MTKGHYPDEGKAAIEKAIAATMARLRCEHSHGQKPPRIRPCRRCTMEGAWWGYVIAGHTSDIQLALVGVDVEVLHAAVNAAGEVGKRE